MHVCKCLLQIATQRWLNHVISCMLGWNLSEGPDLWNHCLCEFIVYVDVGKPQCVVALSNLETYITTCSNNSKNDTMSYNVHIWMCCKHRDQDQRHFSGSTILSLVDSSGHPAQSPCRSLVEPVLCSEFRQLSLRKTLAAGQARLTESSSGHGPMGWSCSSLPFMQAQKNMDFSCEKEDNDVKWWTQHDETMASRYGWWLTQIRNECGWQCRKRWDWRFIAGLEVPGGRIQKPWEIMGGSSNPCSVQLLDRASSFFGTTWYSTGHMYIYIYIYMRIHAYIYIYKCMHIYI